MDRRAFIGTLAGGLLVAPLAAEAQQAGKVWRIGYLGTSQPTASDAHILEALWQGLRERGYVEGQNLVVERRWAESRLERFPDLATELVRLKVDLIVVATTQAARAARQASSTVSIVGILADPVGDGLVASLAKPGGNVTGLAFLGPELVSKRLERCFVRRSPGLPAWRLSGIPVRTRSAR